MSRSTEIKVTAETERKTFDGGQTFAEANANLETASSRLRRAQQELLNANYNQERAQRTFNSALAAYEADQIEVGYQVQKTLDAYKNASGKS